MFPHRRRCFQRPAAGLGAAALLATPAGIAGASGIEVTGAADAHLVGEIERGRPTLLRRGDLQSTTDAERVVAIGGLEGRARFGDFVDGGLRFDTGDLTFTRGEGFSVGGVTLTDEARETWFLREAWLGIESDDETGGRAEVGKRRLTLGDGLLLDGYALGPSFEVFGPGAEARAGLGWIGAEVRPTGAPLVYVEASAAVGASVNVSLLWARDTGFAEEARAEIEAQLDLRALQTALARERTGRTALDCLTPPLAVALDSTLHWLGATLEADWPGGRGALTWVTGVGDVGVTARLTNETCVAFLERRGRATARAQRLDVLGHAASLSARHHVGGPFYPGVFALYLTGDETGGDYDGFLAIAPYPARPALFFDVGAARGVRTPRAATPGVMGRGLRAAGPTLLFAPTEDLSADVTLAWLEADVPNPATGGTTYGQEVDVRVDFDATRAVSLFGELAAARLGDFYPDAGGLHLRAALGVSAAVETAPSGPD